MLQTGGSFRLPTVAPDKKVRSLPDGKGARPVVKLVHDKAEPVGEWECISKNRQRRYGKRFYHAFSWAPKAIKSQREVSERPDKYRLPSLPVTAEEAIDFALVYLPPYDVAEFLDSWRDGQDLQPWLDCIEKDMALAEERANKELREE